MQTGGPKAVPPNLPAGPQSAAVSQVGGAALPTANAAVTVTAPVDAASSPLLGPTESSLSSTPPNLNRVSAPTPAEDTPTAASGSLPPTPPTAGKHDLVGEAQSPVGTSDPVAATADDVQPTAGPVAGSAAAEDDLVQGSPKTAAPGINSALMAGAIGSEAPASQDAAGPPTLQKSSLSAGADLYERHMGTIAGGVDQHARKAPHSAGGPATPRASTEPAAADRAAPAEQTAPAREAQPESPVTVAGAAAAAVTAAATAAAGAGAWLSSMVAGADEPAAQEQPVADRTEAEAEGAAPDESARASTSASATGAVDQGGSAGQGAADGPLAASPAPEALVARTEDMGASSPSRGVTCTASSRLLHGEA